MKFGIVIAALVVVGVAQASAQCPSCSGGGNSSNGGGCKSGGIGIPLTAEKKASWEVVLKYYSSREMAPVGLKQSLEKCKDVEKVTIDEKDQTAHVTYTGKCENLGKLEVAAAGSGAPALILNHAHILVGLAPKKGVTVDMNKAKEEIGLLAGVVGTDVVSGMIEIHGSLAELSKTMIDEAAAKGGCDAIVNQSYEFVSYKVTNTEDYDSYVKEVKNKKGVMFVTESCDGVVSMWVKKAFITPKKDLEDVKSIKVERQ